MAFVALSADQKELLGVARLAADPDYTRAEFGIIVRSNLKGHGLGWLLMQHLIRYGEAEGLREIYGEVLSTNTLMLKMCQEIGFRIEPDPEASSLTKVHLRLGERSEAPSRLRAS